MEKLKEDKEKIVFKTEIEEGLANAIRRYLNQINILAIDEIEIVKNDSALFDEVVAHRVGLIPLKMGKVGARKTATMKISSKKEGFVHSEEIEGSLDVAYDKIPITYLDQGGEIKFSGDVIEGKGVDHVKFSPGIMFYRNVSVIKLDKKLKDSVKRACPDCKIEEKGEKIIIKDNNAKEVGDVLEGIADKEDSESERETKEGELIITLESFGQLKPEQIFNESINVLKKDLKEVAKKIK